MSEKENLSNGAEELDAWRRTWAESSPPGPLSMTGEGEVGGLELLRARSRRGRRRLALGVAGEALIGAVLIAFTVWATRPLPVGLATVTTTFAILAVAAGLAFRLGAAAGTWSPATGAPADLLALERRRLRRRLFALRFGWALLAVEVAFFVPWIAELVRLRDGDRPLAALLAYLWLAAVVAAAALVLRRLERRRRAELAEVEALARGWQADDDAP